MSNMKQMWQDWGTIWFLEEFGLWANQPPELRLGYPRASIFATMQGRSVRLPEIDDDIAVFVQDCINQLGNRHPLQKDLVIEFYVKNRSFDKCANYVGMGKTKAFQQIRCAEAWIDAKLDDYFRLTEAQKKLLTINLIKNAA